MTIDISGLDSAQTKTLINQCATHLTHMGYGVSITYHVRPAPSVFDDLTTPSEVGS